MLDELASRMLASNSLAIVWQKLKKNMAESFVNWPFGEADIQEPNAAAVLAVTVKNTMTIVKCKTAMAADMTVNVTLHTELKRGAILQIIAASDATARAVTYGDNMNAPATAGTISKTKAQTLVFDGTAFNAIGTAVQID
ncbi:MAG: hypothetical protein NW226_17540 [Microscillaceae bacterium]|nr:hypothetical protein [Microscillaceae bacterium]